MNTKKYYVYQFVKDLMPIYSIFMLMFENSGMAISEIFLLLTIWNIPVILLEIPSGMLADRWSRKNLIVIGSLLKTLCFVAWISSDSFTLYAIGFACWGISCACTSGAEEALIYDSLKSKQEEEQLEKVISRGRFLSSFSITFASLVGGFLMMYLGENVALMISIIFGVISIYVSLSFTEVNLSKHQNKSSIKLNTILADEVTFFRKNRSTTILILLFIFVIGTAGILDEFDQLIAKDFGLTIGAVGIWITFRSLLCSLGSLVAPYIRALYAKLFRFQANSTLIVHLCIFAGLSLGAASCIRELWAMGFYAAYFLLMASCEVLVENEVHQEIEEEGRSTIQSMISLAFNMFAMMYYGLLGIVLSFTSIFGGVLFVAIYVVAITILLCILNKLLCQPNSCKTQEKGLE